MTHTSRARLGSTTVVAALVALSGLAACSSASGGTAPAAGDGSSSAAAPSSGASSSGADLTVADSSLGTIVVDRQGRTAYYFDKDTAGSGKSVCSGECLAAWPAITASGTTPTVEGVTAKVGTITRDDGTTQVTVDGRPVYLFAKDTAPGQVTGQGVGNVWYVIAADGSEVKKSAS